jgi:hypothetical protein
MTFCSCTLHALAFLGAILLGAGGLILAVEIWYREGARREQHRLQDAVEGESR